MVKDIDVDKFSGYEEIIKEYKMEEKGKVRAGSERGDTIRHLVKFLQDLEGRKVSTDVIVQGIKKPLKSVSSFLSQLFNAGLVARVPMKDHKRKFVWGIAIPYKTGELEAIISLFNDFTAQKRRSQYLKKKEKELSGEEGDVNYHSKEELKKEKEIDKYLEENPKEEEFKGPTIEEYGEKKKKEYDEEQVRIHGYTKESWNEMVKVAEAEGWEPKIPTPSSNTLKIIVEGNIKILFGLIKE